MNKYFINKSDIINNSNNSLWIYTGITNDLIVPEGFMEVDVVVNLTVSGQGDGFGYVRKHYRWDIDETILTPENLWSETHDGGKWYLIENYNILTPKLIPLEFLGGKFDTEIKISVSSTYGRTKKKDDDNIVKYGVVYDVLNFRIDDFHCDRGLELFKYDVYWAKGVTLHDLLRSFRYSCERFVDEDNNNNNKADVNHRAGRNVSNIKLIIIIDEDILASMIKSKC